MKIGVIDSGIGGLTILKKLIAESPNNEYIYFSDNANCPYGVKTKDEITLLAERIVNYLVKKCHTNVIVIACNTIYANCYEYLKSKYIGILFIDIVSPIIDFIKKMPISTKIGLLATKSTIESGIYQNRLKEYDLSCKYSSILVDMVESNVINLDILKKEIDYFLEKDIDYLILGCTHFPFLEKEIVSLIKSKIITNASVFSSNFTDKCPYKLVIYSTFTHNRIIEILSNEGILYNEVIKIDKLM